MIGFDRSAFAANPDLSRFGNQNVNRVNVRFMTKVFRSILSKIETNWIHYDQWARYQLRTEILTEPFATSQARQFLVSAPQR